MRQVEDRLNKSFIASGYLVHNRVAPAPHSFRFKHTMLFLNLSQLEKRELNIWPMSYNGNGLIRIQTSDYIDHTCKSIRTKLSKFFADMNEKDDIYILTTPSVFRYSFNPATFYFRFNSNKGIRDTVVEVHNTFGESHIYYLDNRTFRHENNEYFSSKQFHVSPFISREGEYTFKFSISKKSVQIHITLHQHGSPLITTEFSSNLTPIQKSSLLKMLPKLVTTVLLTEIRILKIARILFFKLKIDFYKKPVPVKDTLVAPAKGFISKIKFPFV